MYCTAQEVRSLLKGTAEADSDNLEYVGTGAELSDEDINREIVNAAAQIDSVLDKKFTVPFDPAPELIHQLNIDIAAFLVDLTYRKSREYESQNYPIIMRYNRAKEILEFLRTGAMTLPIDDGTERSGAFVINRYGPSLFTWEDTFCPKPLDW